MNLWSSVGFRHVLTLKLHPPPALRLSSNKWVKALMTLSHSSWVISIFWLNVFVQTESSLLAIRKNGLFAALWLHKFKCFSLFLKSCKRRHSWNVQIWRIKKCNGSNLGMYRTKWKWATLCAVHFLTCSPTSPQLLLLCKLNGGQGHGWYSPFQSHSSAYTGSTGYSPKKQAKQTNMKNQ